MAAPERGWREQDLYDLPADGNRYEIIDGSLHVTPPAGPEHHELADEIRMALRHAAPTEWRVIREIGVQVPGGNLIPDLTVLKPGAPRKRMWADPVDIALVLEVESTGSRRHDRFTAGAVRRGGHRALLAGGTGRLRPGDLPLSARQGRPLRAVGHDRSRRRGERGRTVADEVGPERLAPLRQPDRRAGR
ncbi:Uma2 family endonuclease [Micromonospora sp. M12]